MRKCALSLLCLLALPFAFAQTQSYAVIVANGLKDAQGAPLAAGQICATPSNNNAQPIPFLLSTVGQSGVKPVCANIVAGVITTSVATGGTFQLANSLVTQPANVCYNLTVTDSSDGSTTLGGGSATYNSGYNCVQMNATWCSMVSGVYTCNLDWYQPNLAGLVTIQSGPTGPAGPQGPTGPTGAAGNATLASGSAGQLPQITGTTTLGPIPGTAVDSSGNITLPGGLYFGVTNPTTNIYSQSTVSNWSATYKGAAPAYTYGSPTRWGATVNEAVTLPGFDFGAGCAECSGHGPVGSSTNMVGQKWISKNSAGPLMQYDTETLSSNGDFTFAYNEATSYSGFLNPDDEGAHRNVGGVSQPGADMRGTVTASGTNGSGIPYVSVSCTQDCANIGANRTLLDLSRPIASCTVTGHTAANNSTGANEQYTLSGCTGTTITASTAIGTLAAYCGPGSSQWPAGTQSYAESCLVTVTSGSFSAGSIISFGSREAETEMVTSVTALSGGQQTLTLPVRDAHASGSAIYQGGNVIDSFMVATANMSGGGIRYPIPVLGATSATTIITDTYIGTSGSPLSTSYSGNFGNGGSQAITIYPGAEMLDPQNASNSYAIDGNNMLVAANTVPWTSGDAVEESPGLGFLFQEDRIDMGIQDPCALQPCNWEGYTVDAGGSGLFGRGFGQFGGDYTTARAGFVLGDEGNPFSMYTGYGGYQPAPSGLRVYGPYTEGIGFKYAPVPTNNTTYSACNFAINICAAGGLFYVAAPASGGPSNYSYFLFSNAGAHTDGITFTPSTDTYSFESGGGPGILTLDLPTSLGCGAANGWAPCGFGGVWGGYGFTQLAPTWQQATLTPGDLVKVGTAPYSGSYGVVDSGISAAALSPIIAQGTNVIAAGMSSNLLPNSNSYGASGWSGGGTITPGVTDQRGGTTASTIALTSNLQMTLSTALTASTNYTICLSGYSPGGGYFYLYVGNSGAAFGLPTSGWGPSCTTLNSGTGNLTRVLLQNTGGATPVTLQNIDLYPASAPSAVSLVTGATPVATPVFASSPGVVFTGPGSTGNTLTGYSQSWTPAAATASSCVEQTVTVTGVVTTQAVRVSPPASLGAHIWIGSVRASAASTAAVAFCADATGGTPPSGSWLFTQ